MSDLAQFLNIALSTLSVWLTLPDQPVFPTFIQIQFLHDLKEWREAADPFLELATFTKQRPVKVTDVNLNSFIIYESALNAALANELKPTTLNYRLQNGNSKVFPDGKIYEYYTGN